MSTLRTENGLRRNTSQMLSLRIRPEDKTLIDRAAQLHGKNRTDFLLDAARQAAHEVVCDQVIIYAKPEAYAAFLARLDMPPKANARLRKTLQTPAPWDQA